MIQCIDSIPAFEFQLLRLYNVDASKVSDEENIDEEDIVAIVDWSQALSIILDGNDSCFAEYPEDCYDGEGFKVYDEHGWEFNLTLGEGAGWYAWRVRPIGPFSRPSREAE